MLPWSDIATAGMPCRSTSANSFEFFAAPSNIEIFGVNVQVNEAVGHGDNALSLI